MNPYINYQFSYDEKKSFIKFKEILKNNGICNLNDFIHFVNQFDTTISYDTLYSYFNEKKIYLYLL